MLHALFTEVIVEGKEGKEDTHTQVNATLLKQRFIPNHCLCIVMGFAINASQAS